MPFDLEQARKTVKSDKDIAIYLSEKFPDFDYAKAIGSGKTDTEVAEYLSKFDAPPTIQKPRDNVPEWGKENPNLYGAFGAGKELFNKAGRPLMEMGGLAVGSIVGSSAGPIGTVGGAAGGYAIGKGVADKIDSVIKSLEQNYDKSPTLTESTMNALNDIKTGAIYEMGGQIAGRVVTGPIQKTIAPFKKRVDTEGLYKRSLAKEYGIKMTPAEVAKSKALGLMESMFEKSITATDILTGWRLKNQLEPLMTKRAQLLRESGSFESIENTGRRIYSEVTDYLEKTLNLKGEALNKVRAKVLTRLGGNESPLTVGMSTKEVLKYNSEVAFEAGSMAYEEVGKHLGETAFELPHATEVARKILAAERASAKPNSTLIKHCQWIVKEMPDDVAQQLASLPKEVQEQARQMYMEAEAGVNSKTWQMLQKEGSDLRSLIQQDDILKGALPGMRGQLSATGKDYTVLRNALQKDMAIVAKTNPEAYEAWEVANAYWKEIKGIYNAKTIKQVATAMPEKVVDIVFRPGLVTPLKQTKKALGPKGFEKLKEVFTGKLLGVDKHDVFNPRSLDTQMKKYGNEMLSEVYGKSEIDWLKGVVKEGLSLDKKTVPISFLESLTKRQPSLIADTIVGAPDTKLQMQTLMKNISLMKKVTTDKSFKALGNQVLEKIFALKGPTNLVGPESMSKMLEKYDRVLKRFHPPEKVEELRQLAIIGRRLSLAEQIAGNPSGTGQTIMTWGTMGMVVRDPIRGGIIAMLPKMMTKIYLSKFGMKYFTEGFKIPANSQKGVELFAKIEAILNEE